MENALENPAKTECTGDVKEDAHFSTGDPITNSSAYLYQSLTQSSPQVMIFLYTNVKTPKIVSIGHCPYMADTERCFQF